MCAFTSPRIKTLFFVALVGLGIASPPAGATEIDCLPTMIAGLTNSDTVRAFEQMPAQWKKVIRKAQSRRTGYFGDLAPFFENFSADYGRRWVEGDETPQTWVEMGAQVQVTRGGKALVHIPGMETPIICFNEHVQALIEKGVVTENDVIRPALVFKLLGSSKNEYVFVRPGIDAWPDPSKFELMSELPPFDQETWTKTLGSGKLPVGMDAFGIHDLSHVTEFYQNPELMKATREYYRWFQQTPESWKKQVEAAHNQFRKTNRVAPPLSAPALHYLRSMLIGEAFALPNPKESAAIRSMMPEYFSDSEPKKLGDAVAALKKMPEENLTHRIESILALQERVIVKQGGSLRDPYNTERSINHESYWKPLDGVDATGKVQFSETFDITEIHRNSLYGIVKDIEYLYKLRKSHSKKYNANMEALLLNRIARFQLGLKTGLDLQITPEQAIRDNASQSLSPASKTYQYLKSFVPEGGMVWNAFLSPDAIR